MKRMIICKEYSKQYLEIYLDNTKFPRSSIILFYYLITSVFGYKNKGKNSKDDQDNRWITTENDHLKRIKYFIFQMAIYCIS